MQQQQQQNAPSIHRQVSISSSQQMQPLNIQQSTNVAAAQFTIESLQQQQQSQQQVSQKALLGSSVTPSNSNNPIYFQVQPVVSQSIPVQQQAINTQSAGQGSQPQQTVFQSSTQTSQHSQQQQPHQQSSAPLINQSMLAAQQIQMQQSATGLQQQQQQQFPQMQFLLQQVEQQQQAPQLNGSATRKSSAEYAQSTCSGDQNPLSVQSANPPSVASAPSNLSSHSYDLNSPFQSPGTCGSLQSQNPPPPQVTPQTSMAQCNPSSVAQHVTPPQQKQQLPPQSVPSSSSNTSYVVYSQQSPTCASIAPSSISQSMFYSMSQNSSSDLHCSNMDLSDPDLYSTHNQNQHVVQQSTSNATQQEMTDENMFKEPYPVNNSSTVDWQTQQQHQAQRSGTNQFSSTSLNDLSHQHQVINTTLIALKHAALL